MTRAARGSGGPVEMALNPALPLESAVALGLHLSVNEAEWAPLSPAPGYDQRLRVTTGTRTFALPEAAVVWRHRRWRFGAAFEPDLLGDTAWDLMALPPGYDDERDDAGVDWRSRVHAGRFMGSIGGELSGSVRAGASVFVERWSAEIERVLSTPSELAPPLSVLYTHFSSEGTGVGFGASLGIWARVHPHVTIGAAWRSRVRARWDAAAAARTDVPAALQWSEGLPSEVEGSGAQAFERHSPAEIRIGGRYQPVRRGAMTLELIRRDAGAISASGAGEWLGGLTAELPAPDSDWRVDWRLAWIGAWSVEWDWGPARTWAGVVIDDVALTEPTPLFPQQSISAAIRTGGSVRVGGAHRIEVDAVYWGERVREEYVGLSGKSRFGARTIGVRWIWLLGGSG